MTRRDGFTLVELSVVMLIIALAAGVSTLAIASIRPRPTAEESLAWERARKQALRSGLPTRADAKQATLFLPDGRAIGHGLDPWTGKPGREGH
jgi:prepilin-type N-terminal cleavage/methylation domain-containing protein